MEKCPIPFALGVQNRIGSEGIADHVVNSTDLQSEKPRKRAASDYLALAISTCGVGYMPIAPGTWGSAVGVGLFLLLRWLTLDFVQRVGPGRNLILLNPQVHFLAIQL